MGIGLGTRVFAVSTALVGTAAVLHARDRNEQQGALEQSWLSKPPAEQNQWLRDGKPGMPRNLATPALTAVGVGILGATGLGVAMNLGHATAGARTLAGIGAGLLVGGIVSGIVDAAG